MAARSPFKIHKEICSVLGGEASGITKLRSGDILVEVLSCTYEEKLPTFGGLSVTVEPHSRLNSSRSVVRIADLRGTSEDEIVEELDEVTHARRITRHRNENRIETDSIILSFDSPTPPRKIKMGYLNLDVRPYILNPMRCFKCHVLDMVKTIAKDLMLCAYGAAMVVISNRTVRMIHHA